MMAFPLKIADRRGWLDEVTQWLRGSLRIQVCPLVCASIFGEEHHVGSRTENNESSTALKESHIASPGGQKFAKVLARFIIDDMGPMGAY